MSVKRISKHWNKPTLITQQSETEAQRRFVNGIQNVLTNDGQLATQGGKQYTAQSLKDYENFVRNNLTRVPGLGELETYFAVGQVKRSMALPPLKNLR